jgi:2-polyprenyl-3-methyl-5-hydroxy-6-metoxy-1,4-benzoquinol methylase
MMAGLSTRIIEPELLDNLPPDDPQAMGSRRDLKWVNRLMFQGPIMAALMHRSVSAPPRRILEIGCGDGHFMLTLARRLAPRWPGAEITLLDQADIVAEEHIAELAWLGWRAVRVKGDAFHWMANADPHYDLISANLVLHHFTNERLKVLFSDIAAKSSVFVATEPHRNAFALTAVQGLRLFGANQVTLHDAAASVRSGFRGGELGRLWPDGLGGAVEERRIGPFTHTFAARGALTR